MLLIRGRWPFPVASRRISLRAYTSTAMEKFTPFIPWLGGVFAFLCILAALRNNRKKRLIENLPTSKTTGVFIGLVELKGTAESEAPLTSFLAVRPCVHYAWQVQEHWERTVTETYTDSEGKSQTRTRTESGWSTVASGGESQAFYLQDEDGVVLVRPEGAKLEPQSVFSEYCGRGDKLYHAKGPAHSVSDSTHRRHFIEHAFPLHGPVYLVGRARERQDIVAPEIAKDDTAELFLISSRSEDKVTSGYRTATWVWTIFGLLLAVGILVGWDAANHRAPRTRIPLYLGATAAFAFIWGVGWVWTVFNSLIDLRNRVRQGWAQVEVQLKRRHDLIPNLVGIVKGLKDHERQVQMEVTALRSQLSATPPGETGADYHGLQRTLIAVQESYPELKTSDAFQGLHRNLVDAEHRIALARDYFNNIATQYNTRLEQVPDRFVAALAALKPRPLLNAQDFEREAVKVELAK